MTENMANFVFLAMFFY